MYFRIVSIYYALNVFRYENDIYTTCTQLIRQQKSVHYVTEKKGVGKINEQFLSKHSQSPYLAVNRPVLVFQSEVLNIFINTN